MTDILESQSSESTTAPEQGQDYFEKIPVWSDNGKRFEIMADAISGRIPVTRIESWRDFTELLESSFFNPSGVQLVFRGHRRYDWSLMPTLGRVTTNGIINEQLALQQLDRFKMAVRGRLADTSLVDEDDELWSVGQHHGLMTPLLDWTYSPYVALFFAFAKEDRKEESEDENKYRAVYVLNKTFIVEHENETGMRLLEPRKDDHGRLVNQAGLFTFSPYDSTIENKLTDTLSSEDFADSELREASEEDEADILAKYICKIYVRNEERDACLRHLRRMNVHHASLFPDLLGASDYCNILTTEAQLEIEIANAAIVPVSVTVQAEPLQMQASLGSESVSVSYPDIESLLRAPTESTQVEPGRIPLIAEELAQEIEKNKVVDWETRDTVQARLRNVVRIVLRKYGYPASAREQIVGNVLELAQSSSGEEPVAPVG